MLIRMARPADARDVASVHVRSWQVGYRGILPDDHLDGLDIEERARRYTFGDRDPSSPLTFVAVEGTTVQGFATVRTSADTDGRAIGELLALYVDPPQWRRGIATELSAHSRRILAARGLTEAVLWVLEGNVRAERFYGADGWVKDGARREDEVWGLTVEENRFSRLLDSVAGQS